MSRLFVPYVGRHCGKFFEKREEVGSLSDDKHGQVDIVWLKRRLRRLKKQELVIRWGGAAAKTGPALVWDDFFSLNGSSGARRKYPWATLLDMTKDQFGQIVDEFFLEVYCRYCCEHGLLELNWYDRSDLAELGLPAQSGYADIKRQFRQLVKRLHPDVGGDAGELIKVLAAYRRLMREGREQQ